MRPILAEELPAGKNSKQSDVSFHNTFGLIMMLILPFLFTALHIEDQADLVSEEKRPNHEVHPAQLSISFGETLSAGQASSVLLLPHRSEFLIHDFINGISRQREQKTAALLIAIGFYRDGSCVRFNNPFDQRHADACALDIKVETFE